MVDEVDVTDDIVAIGIVTSWALGGEIPDAKLAECVWHLSASEDSRARGLLYKVLTYFEEKNAVTGE